MSALTINPLLKLINFDSREHVKLNDLRQAETKIKNQLARKPANVDRHIEEKYLEIIAQLKTAFAEENPSAPISKKRLIQLTDKILRAQHFTFRAHKHRARTKNVFWPPKTAHHYDLAFYNPLSARHRIPTHHKSKGESSVFFMRCENQGEKILFGNLQVDDKDPDYWQDPTVGNILLKTKNIDLTLIRSALQHALSLGEKEILFHSGDAMEASQFNYSFPKKVLITEENFTVYQTDYEKQLQLLRKLTQGDIIYQHDNYALMFYEKSGDKYQFCIGGDFHRVMKEALKKHLNAGGGAHLQRPLINAVESNFKKVTLDTYLTRVHQLLRTLNPAAPEFPDEQAIRWHKNSINLQLAGYYPGKEIDVIIDYIKQLGLEEMLLANLPHIKALEARFQMDARPVQTLYVNTDNLSDKIAFRETSLSKPVLGEYRPNSVSTLMNLFPDISQKFHPYHNLYNWYEHRIPKLLKKLGLTYEIVKISRTAKKKKVDSYAYKIVGGLEKFSQSPQAIFASHPTLKTDCVTLDELEQVAEKFGLAPAQLEIVNDYLVSDAGPRTGMYDPSADKVTLATASLSGLAHEGFHRLRSQGLIPAAEFSALVQAGRKLVRKTPQLQKYIVRKSPAGKALYPGGQRREEELAALFVEHYYEKERSAQRLLGQQKIPRVKKILNYFRAAQAVLLSRLGHKPSLAQCFLRRLENNGYARLKAGQQAQRHRVKLNPLVGTRAADGL